MSGNLAVTFASWGRHKAGVVVKRVPLAEPSRPRSALTSEDRGGGGYANHPMGLTEVVKTGGGA